MSICYTGCMSRFVKYIINIFKTKSLLHVAYDSGGRNRPTIVLLHGIAATSKTWDALIDEINLDTYRVIAIDLLGFGQSPKPIFCNYEVNDHVNYLRRTIKKLKIRKSFIIVGHSMGAIVAARYSRLYQRKIRRSYLISPPIYLDKTFIRSGLSRLRTDMYINAYNFLLENKDFTIKHSQRLRRILHISDGIDINESNWDSFRLSLVNTVIKQNIIDDIGESFIDTRIIYGTLDEFLVPAAIDSLSHLDNVTLVRVGGADHSVGARLAKEIIKQLEADK